MNFKRIMCIATTAALVLIGSASSALTAKADVGYEWDPCPYCHDGLVWRSESPYQVQVGDRDCTHGHSGKDLHLQNRIHVLRECRDCGRLVGDTVEIVDDFWSCRGLE